MRRDHIIGLYLLLLLLLLT